MSGGVGECVNGGVCEWGECVSGGVRDWGSVRVEECTSGEVSGGVCEWGECTSE